MTRMRNPHFFVRDVLEFKDIHSVYPEGGPTCPLSPSASAKSTLIHLSQQVVIWAVRQVLSVSLWETHQSLDRVIFLDPPKWWMESKAHMKNDRRRLRLTWISQYRQKPRFQTVSLYLPSSVSHTPEHGYDFLLMTQGGWRWGG